MSGCLYSGYLPAGSVILGIPTEHTDKCSVCSDICHFDDDSSGAGSVDKAI